MKYILSLVTVLSCMVASCQKPKSFKTNFPERLSKQDSIHIENILRIDNEGYIESDVAFVEKHILLYVYYHDFTRTYYLKRSETNAVNVIETMVECHQDGTFINYGGESD